MMIIVLQKVPPSLRGELTRWLLEPHPGVFVGHVSALVRDRLWSKCCEKARGGSVFHAWTTNTEQHFQMRCFGLTERDVIDCEGLQLIRIRGHQPQTS